MPPGTPAFALFEDNLAPVPRGRLLHDAVETLDCEDSRDAQAFFDTLTEQSRQGRWIVLLAHYELARAFEAHAPAPPPGLPLARALVFSRCTMLHGPALQAWWQDTLQPLTPQARSAGVLHLAPEWDEQAYAARATRILDYIRAGDCYQANLTFPLQGHSFGHPLALYASLRERQPVQHGALVHDGERWLLSRSPELFFAREGEVLRCKPMKGTAARSADPAQDRAQAEALRTSEKNRAENLMIVDLIRNDLGRIARPGSVRVSRLFELETYATLFQLTSTVEARQVTASLSEVFRALFPCGSVTGAPKLRAMQIIHELEDGPRGIYCGAIGWIAPDGDCDFRVPIRTLLIDSAGSARLDVGSGIVADSDPAAEYAECLTKARFVTDDGLQLIETLRLENGRYPLLARHLARLERSAQELGFPHDADAAEATLQALAASLPRGTQRVRLTLARDGTLATSHALLDATPTHLTACLNPLRLDPSDPRLAHKTSARSFYDSALAEAMQAGHFDALFCNTRGELCEGARSNLFIERAGRLLTPAAHCGLLPGALRAQLLAEGRAEEAVLSLDDLRQADAVWLGNALRGLLRVAVQGLD